MTGGVAPAAARRRDWLVVVPVSMAQIIRAIAAYARVTEQEFLGRTRHLAHHRQLGMWLCRRLLGRSYPEIGRAFGDRDHTTVMHGVARVEKQLRMTPDEVWAELAVFAGPVGDWR